MIKKLLIYTIAAAVVAIVGCKANRSKVGPPIKPEEAVEVPVPPPPPPPAKDAPNDGYFKAEGTLRDMTGLDGCRWSIELDNGDKIMPTNMADFKIVPAEGKRVAVEYKLTPNVMTTCMAGKVARLKQLSEF